MNTSVHSLCCYCDSSTFLIVCQGKLLMIEEGDTWHVLFTDYSSVRRQCVWMRLYANVGVLYLGHMAHC